MLDWFYTLPSFLRGRVYPSPYPLPGPWLRAPGLDKSVLLRLLCHFGDYLFFITFLQKTAIFTWFKTPRLFLFFVEFCSFSKRSVSKRRVSKRSVSLACRVACCLAFCLACCTAVCLAVSFAVSDAVCLACCLAFSSLARACRSLAEQV